MARCVGKEPPLGNVSPSISCCLLLSEEEKGKERETRKGQTLERQRKAKDKGKYDGVSDSEADCCIHQQSFGQHRRIKKELGYWIFSLIMENTMSFVVNQAETFNYKTNYEVVNVSHLTQPSPKQNRTFSGGEVEERSRGKKQQRGSKKRH